MKYRHLTLEMRYQIQAALAMKVSKDEIARSLAVHRSTVYREIARNRSQTRYTSRIAHDKCVHRRRVKELKRRKIKGTMKKLVEIKLQLGWSPEQISGRLWREEGIKLSYETIYQHILRDSKQGGPLRYYLRFGGYKYHRYKKSRHAAKTRLKRKFLEDRPVEANERSTLGHWERDLVEGKRGRGGLLTIVDRKSRYLLVRRVNTKREAEVTRKTNGALSIFAKINKTVTNDNGVEFQRPERLNLPVFYSEPSAPWQRGSVENMNGLIRQYMRKRTAIEDYPDWLPQALEETLNHRPRKTLNYLTPHEVHMNEKNKLLPSHFGLKSSLQS